LSKIENEKGIAYPVQRYASQLRYLFNGLNGSYKYVSADAVKRFDVLKKEWDGILNGR